MCMADGAPVDIGRLGLVPACSGDVAAVAALEAGGSAAGGSAAVIEVVLVFVSTPGAVSTSILAAGAELNLVSATWD